MYKHELIVCYSDNTWREENLDCDRLLSRVEAQDKFSLLYVINIFKREEGKREASSIETDIVFVNIINISEKE
jgi:hypothetical protein